MKPARFLQTIVDPGLAVLSALTTVKSDDRARVLVLAIAGQETEWRARRQFSGPARSYWQFERYGGVAELVQKCPAQLEAICVGADIPFTPNLVHEAMAWHDGLACAMARLLLWRDPAPLPELGDVDGGWNYYLRNWRPGAPHPDVWPVRYKTALELVGGAGQPKLL